MNYGICSVVKTFASIGQDQRFAFLRSLLDVVHWPSKFAALRI